MVVKHMKDVKLNSIKQNANWNHTKKQLFAYSIGENSYLEINMESKDARK